MRLRSLTVLSDDEIVAIHEASLRILAETGLVVNNKTVLGLLRDSGAFVDLEACTAKIPPHVTSAALKTVPSRVTLYNRNRDPSATLGDGRSYASCGADAIYFQDTARERRPATKRDVSNLVTIADALDGFSVVCPPAVPQDVPTRSCYLHAAEAVFRGTTKHLYMAPESTSVATAILEMARIVAGTDDLSTKPLLSFQVSVQSPLTWSEDLANMVLLVAEAGIPLCYHTAPLLGLSSPITLAGLLALYNAEVLSGVVISQIARRGTPVIYGGGWGTFDLRHTTRVLSSPEGALLRIAGGQITRFYGIPSHCMGPDTDSHCYDEQNGWEKMLTVMSAVMSGHSLIVNSSMFGTGMTVSCEQLVMDHELLRIANRLLRGIAVSPETVALDVIHKVGPGGSYIMDDHTLRHLRSGEHSYSDITNHLGYDQWRARGSLTVMERAREAAEQILQSHHAPPLETVVQQELAHLIEVFEREAPAS